MKVLHSKYLPNLTPKAEVRKKVVVDLDDAEIIDKARACKSGSLFSMLYAGEWQGLYASQSSADVALCNQLAFWTGRNEAQIDRIFRTSGLMRPKWDSKRGNDTYGNITIGKACAACTEVYEPNKYDDETALAISFFKDGKVGVTEKAKNYNIGFIVVLSLIFTFCVVHLTGVSTFLYFNF